jgi:GTP-binding protein
VARPIVAIVGRPNVGKSTLFNRLIGARQAVVHDEPGTTRDRLYAVAEWRGVEFTVVDTGGIGPEAEDTFLPEVIEQAREAIAEADVLIFVVDAAAGVLPSDLAVADLLRRTQKPVIVAANKAEGRRQQLGVAEFYAFGLGDPIPISALNGTGINDLLDAVFDQLPRVPEEPEPEVALSLAIVGRPNVGKSSLLNALVGERRAIVSEVPGTTRDVVDTLISYEGETVRLVDTAGIRRRGRIEPGIERFSVLRAVRAIERCDVAAVLLDAREGVTAQDAHIAGYVRDAARGIILVVNKWDLVPKHARIAAEYSGAIRRALPFVDYAPILFISALTGQRVEQVLETAREVQRWRRFRIPTAKLNELVRAAVAAHPLLEKGRALKVYYVTQAELAPPTFVFFVNDPDILHFSYERYLENRIRAEYPFTGTPIRLVFRGRAE